MSLPLDIIVRALGATQAATQIAGVDRAVGNLGTRARSGATTILGRSFGAATTGAQKLGGALGHAKSQIGSVISGPLGLVGLGTGIFGVAGAMDATLGGASRFDEAMSIVKRQTGATGEDLAKLSDAVLNLANGLPQSPEELAAGLYHVESAGYRGAKALDILKIAAQGAMAGGADLESVTNAIVGAEQSGIKGAEDLGKAMGTLNAIVGAGNMRMQDLADAFGSGILASARTFGVSMQSVGAALATMTDEGIPAIDAATRLRMSMSLLGAPTSKAVGLLKDIGIKQFDLAKAMRSPGGFVSAIGLLRDKMMKAGLIGPDGNPNPKGAALLSRAFGGGRSSAAIMTLVSNFDLLRQKEDAVNKGASGFPDAVKQAADQAANKWKTFRSTVDVAAIRIGNVLLPMVTDAIEGLGNWIATHQTDIVGWAKDLASFLRDAGGFIQGTVIPAVQGIAGAWNSLPGPLKDLLVKGFVAGKVTKFLFDVGPMDIAKGLGGLAKNLFSRGGSAATPMYTKEVGLGGVGGGAAGGMGTLGKVALVAEAVGLVVAVNDVRQAISDGNSAIAHNINTQTDSYLATRPNLSELEGSLSAIDKGITDIQSNPLYVLVRGDALEQLKEMRAKVAAQIAAIRGLRGPIGNVTPHIDRLTGKVDGIGTRLVGKVGNLTPQLSRLKDQNQSLIGKVGNVTPAISRLNTTLHNKKMQVRVEVGAVTQAVYVTAKDVQKTVQTAQKYGRSIAV